MFWLQRVLRGSVRRVVMLLNAWMSTMCRITEVTRLCDEQNLAMLSGLICKSEVLVNSPENLPSIAEKATLDHNL
jgi:hypothetical protein